jgi:hypothetical protein
MVICGVSEETLIPLGTGTKMVEPAIFPFASVTAESVISPSALLPKKYSSRK